MCVKPACISRHDFAKVIPKPTLSARTSESRLLWDRHHTQQDLDGKLTSRSWWPLARDGDRAGWWGWGSGGLELTVHIISQFCFQWPHVGSWKYATGRIFTSRKLAPAIVMQLRKRFFSTYWLSNYHTASVTAVYGSDLGPSKIKGCLKQFLLEAFPLLLSPEELLLRAGGW